MSALQSSTGLSIDFSNLPAATAEASAAASPVGGTTRFRGIRRFRGCSSMLARRAAVGDYARDVEEGPVHREGQVFYRAAPTQKTHAVWSCHVLPLAVAEVRPPVDESLGLVDGYLTGRLPRSLGHGPLHAERRGQTLRKTGGHEPVVEPSATSFGYGGQSLEGEGRGGPGHKGEAGTDGGGFFRCLARRGDGCASLQRARRSMLARSVLRNGQFP